MTDNELRSTLGPIGTVFPIGDASVSDADLRHITGLYANRLLALRKVSEFRLKYYSLIVETELSISRVIEVESKIL